MGNFIMSEPAKKHFKILSDEEMKEQQLSAQNINSIKNEKKAEKAFKEYLEQAGETDLNFFCYTEDKLDYHLAKFWFAARKKDEGLYRVSSLENMRYSLNRALKHYGHNYDITRKECVSFTKSIKAFEDATTLLKKQGQGYIDHTPEITPTDLHTIYTSKYLDPDRGPRELQNKVQFDIPYYFARRGGENIYDMTKETFKCVTDRESGISYITRAKDEATKNHKETDNEIISGYMPELPGSKYCPVQSFLTYKISLSTNKDYLWQRPNHNDFPPNGKGTWYGPVRVGHNPIDNFVSTLVKNCGLKHMKYTNHSLRVAAITTLTRQSFMNKQIMSLTGHKSSTSLAIYQRVNSDEKMQMGFSLCSNLLAKSDNNALPQPPAPLKAIAAPPDNSKNQQPTLKAITPASINEQNVKKNNNVTMKENVNEQNAVVQFVPDFNCEPEDPILWDQDFDLMVAIAESEEVEMKMSQIEKKTTENSTTCVSKRVVKRTSPNVPMIFNNCKIEGNITINFPK